MTIHPYDFIFAGLALDIAGAVILAKGFMLKNAKAAYYESRMLLGENNHLLKSALLQRAEAVVGGFLLVIGFGLQIRGNLHGGIAAIEPGWVNSMPRMGVVLLGAVILSAAILLCARWRGNVSFYRIYFRDYTGEALRVPDGDPPWLDRTAALLVLKRGKHESDAALLTRVGTRRAKLAAKHAGKASGLLP